MSTHFSLLEFNVDQANREENVPQTTWDKRTAAIKDLIVSANTDIVCLMELRNLATSAESANQFLAHPLFERYEIVHRRYCHYKDAFHFAMLIDPTKFWVKDTVMHNYLNNPDHDYAVMMVTLQCRKTLRFFNVGVTHLPMAETTKETCIRVLRNIMLNSPHPTVVCGDFNFFDDKDGKQQRQFMLDRCEDFAHPLTIKKTQETLSGTFLGFPHDDFKKSYASMSRLDHVFAPQNQFKLVEPADSPSLETFKLDNQAYETMTYPSDHLAIRVQLTF